MGAALGRSASEGGPGRNGIDATLRKPPPLNTNNRFSRKQVVSCLFAITSRIPTTVPVDLELVSIAAVHQDELFLMRRLEEKVQVQDSLKGAPSRHDGFQNRVERGE